MTDEQWIKMQTEDNSATSRQTNDPMYPSKMVGIIGLILVVIFCAIGFSYHNPIFTNQQNELTGNNIYEPVKKYSTQGPN